MYHINNNGEVKTCSADKGRCRFSQTAHFATQEEAVDFIERIYADQYVAPTYRKKKIKVDDAQNTPLSEIENGIVLDRDSGRIYNTDLVIVEISGVDELRALTNSPAEAKKLAASENAMNLIVNAEDEQPTDELYSDEFVVIEKSSGSVLSPNIVIVDKPEHPDDLNDFYRDDEFALDYSDSWGMPLSIDF